MSEYKQVLFDLMRQDGNKLCFECNAPSPQWASTSYGIHICLECAGIHRGLGVHLSFVRSISMDKWTVDQVKRMELGGNLKCKEFFKSSPNYSSNMSIPDKYNSDFAAQYRDKLTAECEGRSWVPSATPTSKPMLKKSSSNTFFDADSFDGNNSYGSYSSNQGATSQKSQNEAYFANLGSLNNNRSEDLPPSQGGKYQGFGSAMPESGSTSAPTMDDLVNDPLTALSKGWSFFSSTAVSTAKAVNQNVIQPTAQKVLDPEFQNQVKGYVGTMTKQVHELGSKGNYAIQSYIGNNPVGGKNQYSAIQTHEDESEEFFGSYGAGVDNNGSTQTFSNRPASPGFGSTGNSSFRSSPNLRPQRRKERSSSGNQWKDD